MNSTQIQSAISWLLVISTLHLLGACPCGCLEHNGWYQAAASLVGSADSGSDGSPSRHEDDCDDVHSPTYFLAETHRVLVTNRTILIAGLFDKSCNLAESLATDQGSRVLASRDSLSGLLLRSRLQVLRL